MVNFTNSGKFLTMFTCSQYQMNIKLVLYGIYSKM